MATRGRGGAVGGGVWPVYEDFKPNSEWQQDAHSHNLIISIPGFMKEQLRVSTEGRNIIRVRGERLMAGNKWSRFLEDFEVPENSDMNSIRAKFHEGVLTITVPKKIVEKPHEIAPEEKKGVETQKDEKHGQVHDRSKEASSSKTEKGAEGELEKTTTNEERNLERGKEVGKDETAAGKIKLKMDDGVIGKDETAAGKIKLKMDDGVLGKDKGKQGKRKQVIESSGVEDGAVKAKDKSKQGNKTSGAEFTKAVKGLGELNEERQLMVNMGVALLVIVSFSAYVTYKFVAGDDKK